ncbi:hypothetical protein BJ165DRAFT_1344741, partial [Panaeolus papilionaceus]
PIPPLPDDMMTDPIITNTLSSHPHLFNIVTPINIDKLAKLTSNHPNLLFQQSIIQMLCEGTWSLAMVPENYHATLNPSAPPPLDPIHAQLLQDQRDTGLHLNHYSEGFQHLLPGMYAMPIHAVPKDNGEALHLVHLVTNHSKGQFSLNSMIAKVDLGYVPLDNMRVLGSDIIDFHQQFPGEELIAWKSDVAEAYHLIPMHPHWQIKQVEKIDDLFYVNRCNIFGGCASQTLFVAFMSLVSWVAKYKCGIASLCAYSDDHYRGALALDTEFYKHYQHLMPQLQAL